MPSSEATVPQEDGGRYVSKWNILFDKTQSHWMLADPEEGALVFPCYACRDIFSVKESFVDHINRISIGLKYHCPSCSSDFTFYNPCMLLLHARKHFATSGGVINLDNITIFTLPIGMIGFPPHPDVPVMFDDEEEEPATKYISSSFYNPMGTQKGSKLVQLVATYLLFLNSKVGTNKSSMILKQVCTNIPKCVFTVTNTGTRYTKDSSVSPQIIGIYNNNNSNIINNNVNSNNTGSVNNKTNITDNNATSNTNINFSKPEEEKLIIYRTVDILVNKAVDNKDMPERLIKCPECNKLTPEAGIAHFQQGNIPGGYDMHCESCDFISPGPCAFKAHNRLHSVTPPFVCPECGITFEKFIHFLEHEKKSCYHFAKQIKLKCTKRHCSKIFTYHVNYKQHFSTHILTVFKCPTCCVYYLSRDEFNSHLIDDHLDEDITAEINYQCTVCHDRYFDDSKFQEHLESHCDISKVNNQMYVYLCRYCRNHFRTSMNYATHLTRCSKKDTMLSEFVNTKFGPAMTYCTNCSFIVFFKVSLTSCPKCGTSDNLFNHKSEAANMKKVKCTLCSNLVSSKVEHKCKFEKPIVVLNNLGDISETVVVLDITNSTNAETKSPDKMIEKRKRKSTSPNHQNYRKKPARPSIEQEEITLDVPTPFDGTYSCKLCEFSSAERSDFHDHLLTHRNGAVYQCMECGESFVVKPSFEKHLIYFHQIMDIDRYISENDCCNTAVETEERNESDNRPLDGNQCKVCGQMFKDEFSLNKHTRVHGMAFLRNTARVGN